MWEQQCGPSAAPPPPAAMDAPQQHQQHQQPLSSRRRRLRPGAAGSALSSLSVVAAVAVVALSRQLSPSQAFLLPPTPSSLSPQGARGSGDSGQRIIRTTTAAPLWPGAVRGGGGGGRGESLVVRPYSLRERGSSGGGGGGGGRRPGGGSSSGSGVTDVETLLNEVEAMQARAFKEVGAAVGVQWGCSNVYKL